MKREDMIDRLKKVAPIVTDVTGTADMGYEFSAIVPDGVIEAMPGMLLDYSGGEWPPNSWGEDKTDEELQTLLKDFLLDETWEVIAWDELTDEQIEYWLEEVENLDS
ncbi:MAG TPA: hypothetical protein DHO02_05605 [Syntrophaceae bacterium]|nr:hypothetical protein [Syntrophaceae bacterium]